MAAINGPNIVNDGLVYYIDPSNPVCYSGSGTSAYNVASSSLVGGTLTNGVIYDYANNGAMYFDGTNDYIAISDSNLLDLGSSFTISAWIKINDLSTATYHSIYSSLDVTTNSLTKGVSLIWYRVNQFGINANSLIIQYGQSAWAWNLYCSDTNTINDNAIHHVVVTVTSANTNNPTVKFYTDGVLKNTTWWGQSTKAAILYSTDTTSLRLGSLYTPANPSYYNSYSNINIYNVQICKKELSFTEITQIYNATRSRFLVTENIVRNGLVFSIDASKITSYPGTGTSIYDLSGLSNNGTLVSSPTFSNLNGGSLVFNGNPYITRSSALNTGQNFSVTAWIYPTALGARNAVVGNGYPYTTDNGWLFCICDNNFSLFQALFLSIGQNNALVISNSYVFQLNKWSHVACSVSGGGSSIKFYVNGVETSYGFTSGSGRTISYSNNEFHVGMRHSSTPERFQGNISQVQIYNTTLTAAEIQQNYNATKNKYNILPAVSDLLVLNFDAGNRASYAGTGTTWIDLSFNKISASLINGPVFVGTGSSTYLTFDGSNDYASSADPGIAIPLTMSVWIYFNSLSGWQTFIGQDTSLAVSRGRFYFQRTNLNSAPDNLIAGRINFSLTKSDGNIWVVNSLANPVVSTWINYTIVITSSTLALYQNAVLQDSLSGTFSLQAGTGPITYGVGWYDNILADYCNANIGNIQIYNKALSATEILQNFNFYRSRYGI